MVWVTRDNDGSTTSSLYNIFLSDRHMERDVDGIWDGGGAFDALLPAAYESMMPARFHLPPGGGPIEVELDEAANDPKDVANLCALSGVNVPVNICDDTATLAGFLPAEIDELRQKLEDRPAPELNRIAAALEAMRRFGRSSGLVVNFAMDHDGAIRVNYSAFIHGEGISLLIGHACHKNSLYAAVTAAIEMTGKDKDDPEEAMDDAEALAAQVEAGNG